MGKKMREYKFQIGDKVRLLHDDEPTEYGVVLATSYNKEILENDCLVAFLGLEKPVEYSDEKPKVFPYILNFCELSLEKGWE